MPSPTFVMVTIFCGFIKCARAMCVGEVGWLALGQTLTPEINEKWRQDIWHRGIQYNDTQHYDPKHNDKNLKSVLT